MCIIVDANLMSRVFLTSDDADFQPLHESIFGMGSRDAYVVYGGKLLDEYVVSARMRSVLVELDRAGRARAVPRDQIEADEEVVDEIGIVSDDQHVLALARVGGVRLLCTDDANLIRDFKTKALIDRPRGRIYTCSEHDRLLREDCSEGGAAA